MTLYGLLAAFIGRVKTKLAVFVIDGLNAIVVHDHHPPIGDLPLRGNCVIEDSAPGVSATIGEI